MCTATVVTPHGHAPILATTENRANDLAAFAKSSMNRPEAARQWLWAAPPRTVEAEDGAVIRHCNDLSCSQYLEGYCLESKMEAVGWR